MGFALQLLRCIEFLNTPALTNQPTAHEEGGGARLGSPTSQEVCRSRPSAFTSRLSSRRYPRRYQGEPRPPRLRSRPATELSTDPETSDVELARRVAFTLGEAVRKQQGNNAHEKLAR